MSDNVIKFRSPHALFNPEVRGRLQHGIKDLTEKPEETVDRVEQLLCTAIISMLRSIGKHLGARVGDKVGGKVVGIHR